MIFWAVFLCIHYTIACPERLVMCNSRFSWQRETEVMTSNRAVINCQSSLSLANSTQAYNQMLG